MFPNRPQRPMSIFPERRQPEQHTNPNFLSHFMTQDGQLDLDKILGTASQVKDIYSQVSPYITKFFKK